MSKRGVEELLGDEVEEASKKQREYEHVNKHTLDSDEDDSDVDESRLAGDSEFRFEWRLMCFYCISRYNVLDENDIQGEEEGVSGIEGGVKV